MLAWIQERIRVIRGESNIIDFPLHRRLKQMQKDIENDCSCGHPCHCAAGICESISNEYAESTCECNSCDCNNVN